MPLVSFVETSFTGMGAILAAALLGLAVNGTGVSKRDLSEWFPRLDVEEGRDVLSLPPLRADRRGVDVRVVEARERVSRFEEAREGVFLCSVVAEVALLMVSASSRWEDLLCSARSVIRLTSGVSGGGGGAVGARFSGAGSIRSSSSAAMAGFIGGGGVWFA